MGKTSGVCLILVIVVALICGAYLLLKYHEKFHKPKSSSNYKFDAIVCSMGDETFTTVSEAIISAPSYSSTRFFIRVCSGVYNEVVVVPQNKTNIVLIGDGAETTKITANRHISDFSTSETATFCELFYFCANVLLYFLGYAAFIVLTDGAFVLAKAYQFLFIWLI